MLAAYVGIGIVIPFLLLASEPLFSLRTVLTILAPASRRRRREAFA